MTRSFLTEPYDLDGRLKILWLDDQPSSMMKDERSQHEDSRRFSDWFAIESFQNLSDLSTIKKATKTADLIFEYNRTDAPYDVYILDFRLCDGVEHCNKIEHQNDGTHGPAAGLLGGVLVALNWPDHPQCIIPHSGFEKEASDIWPILRSFLPDSLWLTDHPTAKDRVNFDELLTTAAAQNYRKALARSFASGSAVLPLPERLRLTALLAENGDWVEANETVDISTVYGLRSFKLGSLFFDKKIRSKVPTDQVRNALLVDTMREDPITLRARQLAELFWFLRRTDLSYYAYLRRGIGAPFDVNQTFPWIGDLCWRPRKKIENIEATCVVRLAILFLILFEHQARTFYSAAINDEKTLELLTHVDKLYHMFGGLEPLTELWDEDIAAENIAKLAKLQQETVDRGGTSALDLLALQLPIKESDIVQLVDPIPGKAPATSLSIDHKVGKGLKSILDGVRIGSPEHTIDLSALLHGESSSVKKMLLESEWYAVKRMASELLRTADMPRWLIE